MATSITPTAPTQAPAPANATPGGKKPKLDLSKLKSYDLATLKDKLPKIQLPKILQIIASKGTKVTANEINLVPDIKEEIIKSMRLRNFIYFLCIVAASTSLGFVIFFASVAGGQQAVVDGKKETLDELSSKVNAYSDLGDFLTIRDQLGNLSAIANNKKLLSRTFGVLSTLLPTGADTITISELNINLSGESPTISFDAQANAGDPPYIDYNVLDSFKKSMQYMYYDYGTYVDKEGAEIPSYCIIENGTNGATLSDPERGYYAYWMILGEGCNPSYTEEDEEIYEEEEEEEEEAGEETTTSTNTTTTTDDDGNTVTTTTTTTTTITIVTSDGEQEITQEEYDNRTKGYTVEDYQGQKVVRIWRTPQFADWHKTESATNTTTNANSSTTTNTTTTTTLYNAPYISLDGEISNVAHFASNCITYTGTENETNGKITWVSNNDSCMLVPEGINGINISDSSNGRDASGELVLRFSAVITLNPEVFSFNNKHVLPIGPAGRYNVTDSYVQIQSLFAKRAEDCLPGDTVCNNNVTVGN